MIIKFSWDTISLEHWLGAVPSAFVCKKVKYFQLTWETHYTIFAHQPHRRACLSFLLAHSSCFGQNLHPSSHHHPPVRPEQRIERLDLVLIYRWLTKKDSADYEEYKQRHDDHTSIALSTQLFHDKYKKTQHGNLQDALTATGHGRTINWCKRNSNVQFAHLLPGQLFRCQCQMSLKYFSFWLRPRKEQIKEKWSMFCIFMFRFTAHNTDLLSVYSYCLES